MRYHFLESTSHGRCTGLASDINLEQSRGVANGETVEGENRCELEAPTPPEKCIHITFSVGTH